MFPLQSELAMLPPPAYLGLLVGFARPGELQSPASAARAGCDQMECAIVNDTEAPIIISLRLTILLENTPPRLVRREVTRSVVTVATACSVVVDLATVVLLLTLWSWFLSL